MKTFIQMIIVLAASVLSMTLVAQEVRQITWEDLVPAHLADVDPVAHLTPDQQDLVGWIIYMLETLPLLKKYGIDLEAIMKQTKMIQTALVEELDGQKVRLPGYLLPLEVIDNRVLEFLLVPYVGACIHVPPPPPNQIVHVKSDRVKDLKKGGLFDPVWVTGQINAKPMAKDLFLIDGSATIDIGYTMQADRVEAYLQ